MPRAKSSKPDQVTIFDVAERAGVSIKTVSRVINNEPNVREGTRSKVLTAIDALNYRPNSAARGLSSARSYVIGLIYENPDEFSYVKDVLNGALAECEAQGYALLLRPITLPNARVAELVRAFAVQTRMDGVVLPAPVGDIDEVVQVLTDLKIEYATITPKNPRAQAINIFCDDASASREVVEYLVELGHECIGFVKGHPDHRASEDRYRGYRDALEAAGLKSDADLVRQGYFTFESGRQAARELLALTQPPSAIVASNDDMAAGVLFEARERGLAVPEALSIVGFDDTPVASHTWPPLTTVRQPIVEMAQTATGLLIRRLRGEDVAGPEAAFHCDVVVRDSAGEQGVNRS